jgi:hypothetical protein
MTTKLKRELRKHHDHRYLAFRFMFEQYRITDSGCRRRFWKAPTGLHEPAADVLTRMLKRVRVLILSSAAIVRVS